MTSLWLDVNLLGPDEYARLLYLTTGINKTGDELMTLGRRLHNVEKAFNTLHAGFSRKDDMPPARLMNVPIGDGPWKGETLSREAWDGMLTEYYKAQGWDESTGWQTAQMLDDLGLPDVADKLKRFGKLPAA
jgi:aldehyde:ferredoxin oxidoreductase